MSQTEVSIKDIEDYKSYLGNKQLKRAGVEIEWTPEMVKEYVRCVKDPIYFAERYIKIVNLDHGLIPITMYDYQKDITRKVMNNRRTAVVTSRQAGKTTTAVCVILHYVLFNKHKLVALLANKGDSAREILDRIQIAYEALPKWLQQGVVEWNKGSVQFENGSKIIAAATSSSAIRGKSVSFLYIDETAFVENWEQFSSAVMPTIVSGTTTKVLFTSTPNGLNHFYKTCKGAREGTNGYQFVEVKWNDVPGRGDKWREEYLASIDFNQEQFEQEMCCQFLGSSGTLIDSWKLKELTFDEPLHEKNSLIMYKRPIDGHSYTLVADVSRGKGLDYSAFSIIDVTNMPYKQVCTYRNNMTTPSDYAAVIHAISKHYNNANILVEINDIGEQVSSILYDDYEYENILFTENSGRGGKRLVAGFGSNKCDKGVRTTKSVKSVGCSLLKLLIEQNQLIITDFETIKELSTFSKKGTSWEAEPGNNDDLVMGLVLFAWLSNQKFFRELTDINTISKLRDTNEEQMMNELTPFGIIDDGNEPIDEPMVISSNGDSFLRDAWMNQSW